MSAWDESSVRFEIRDSVVGREFLRDKFLPAIGHWVDAGLQVGIHAWVLEDDRSVEQNRFLWGYVYKHISEQAQIDGIGAQAEGWHLYYKRMFLGYRFARVKVPGQKRSVITKELKSTSDLKTRAMSKYIDEVMAHAVTTFGVQFPPDESYDIYRKGKR